MIETLGEARNLGWRLTAQCAAGKQDGMHRYRKRVYCVRIGRGELVHARAAAPSRPGADRGRWPSCSSRRPIWSGLGTVEGTQISSREVAERDQSITQNGAWPLLAPNSHVFSARNQGACVSAKLKTAFDGGYITVSTRRSLTTSDVPKGFEER